MTEREIVFIVLFGCVFASANFLFVYCIIRSDYKRWKKQGKDPRWRQIRDDRVDYRKRDRD